ncbi:hypothetical protein ABI59_23960 [Acidobacteria bacterium Mor1]|nr:hypothetical protein ABI59_23960 [Acidobacteria bacterium Mor1]
MTLEELARHVGGSVVGDPGRWISGVATLQEAGPEQISFLTNARYRADAEATGAGAVLTAPGSGLQGVDLIEVENPYRAWARVLERFHPRHRPEPGISPDARVHPTAELGEGVFVGPFAVVEEGVRLEQGTIVGAGSVIEAGCRVGAETELRPRVILYRGTRVGRRCLLHSGVVLGADGFGFATDAEGHHKVPQIGGVLVEDDVEIGANSTVDRGALGDTVIGQGSKIDNLVMVAHGVQIGAGSILVAQSGVAGSTKLGKRVTIAGQSGIVGHVEVGDHTVVAAKSAVFSDQPAGQFLAGTPAVDHRVWKRAQAALKRLPEMRSELRKLEARLAALEGASAGEED